MDHAFADLIERIRTGDESAATEVVRLYEPVVRREIRLWLRQCRALPLSRVLDSSDICQSVLARFFAQASEDRLQVQDAQHLRNLLVIMARHRFIRHVKSSQAVRRDIRRSHSYPQADLPEPSNRAAPVDSAVESELLLLIQSRLSSEERELADRRALGESWAEIVATMGGTADGRRVQLARTEARVMADLGLGSHEG